MPVHAPGPRLFKSIPFKHLGGGKGGGGPKESNIHINITPFVDMMTILVTFLLMVFSASGEILAQDKAIVLPKADQKKDLRPALIISIDNDSVAVMKKGVASLATVKRSSTAIVDSLLQRLKNERAKFLDEWAKVKESDKRKQNCINPKADAKPEDMCEDGPCHHSSGQGDTSHHH